jgi:hypothetical protein
VPVLKHDRRCAFAKVASRFALHRRPDCRRPFGNGGQPEAVAANPADDVESRHFIVTGSRLIR